MLTECQARCFERKLDVAKAPRSLCCRCSSGDEWRYDREADTVVERVLALEAKSILADFDRIARANADVIQPELRVRAGYRRDAVEWRRLRDYGIVQLLQRHDDPAGDQQRTDSCH